VAYARLTSAKRRLLKILPQRRRLVQQRGSRLPSLAAASTYAASAHRRQLASRHGAFINIFRPYLTAHLVAALLSMAWLYLFIVYRIMFRTCPYNLTSASAAYAQHRLGNLCNARSASYRRAVMTGASLPALPETRQMKHGHRAASDGVKHFHLVASNRWRT